MEKFKAIQLIEQEFVEKGLYFQVEDYEDIQEIIVGFPIDSGPNTLIHFISRGDDNAVAVRIFGIVNNIPEEKIVRVLEACNILNLKWPALKFCLDIDFDVNVEYDFPLETSDESVGPVAFETLMKMHVIKDDYGVFMEALYTDNYLWNWLDRIELNLENSDMMEHRRSPRERKGSFLQ